MSAALAEPEGAAKVVPLNACTGLKVLSAESPSLLPFDAVSPDVLRGDVAPLFAGVVVSVEASTRPGVAQRL